MPALIIKKRKQAARQIRAGQFRDNHDTTVSSHVMESGEGEGKYKYQANPTIFPEKDGSWKTLTHDKNNPNGPGRNDAYHEAQKRGEVFGFKREKRAVKFAAGSWKQGKDRKDAMKKYREGKREAKLEFKKKK